MAETGAGAEPFGRGHVVWHDGLFRGSGRPWFVLSDDRHPFHGEEYLVAGITTTEREDAIELGGDGWSVGGLPKTSYVSPWFLTTLKHAAIERGVGAVTPETTVAVGRAVTEYVADSTPEPRG